MKIVLPSGTGSGGIPSSEKGAANGVVPLNANGKIDTEYLTINCAKIVGVTNTAERLALSAYDGFMVAVETEADIKLAYGLNANLDPSVSSNWLPMGDVSSKVESINGKTGVVELAKADVGLGNVDNTADMDKNVLSANKLLTARKINNVSFDGTEDITISDSTKEPVITAGTTSQYFRGDKTFQTLNKSAVGLNNVDNTADLDKPISTAQAAVNELKMNLTDSATSLDWGPNSPVRAGEVRGSISTVGGFRVGQLIKSKSDRPATGTVFNTTEAANWIRADNDDTIIQSLSASGSVPFWHSTALVTATSAAVIATLPSASSVAGKSIEVIKCDSSSNTVIVKPYGTELLNGSNAGISLASQWDSVVIRSDGTNSYVMSEKRKPIPIYLKAYNNATQTVSTVGSIINFSLVSKSGGSSITLSNKCFLLTAGETYELSANLGLVSFSGNEGWVQFKWRTGQVGGSGEIQGTAGEIDACSMTATSHGGTPIASAIYTADVDTYMHLEITGTNLLVSVSSSTTATIKAMR